MTPEALRARVAEVRDLVVCYGDHQFWCAATSAAGRPDVAESHEEDARSAMTKIAAHLDALAAPTPTIADRVAALITAHTGKPCPFPVAELRANGGTAWLYLWCGHDLAVMVGPKPSERARGWTLIGADLSGCRDLGEALAVVEEIVAVESAADAAGGVA